MGAKGFKLTALAACAIILTLVFSAFFAWTYSTEARGRLGYDFSLSSFVDIDGDGLTDAYRIDPPIGSSDPGTRSRLTVYRNIGGGHLEQAGSWKAPGEIEEVLTADLDHDGSTELLASVRFTDAYETSTFVLTLKDWKLKARERPLQVEGLCNLSRDGRMQVDAGNSVWEMVNGSLDMIPADEELGVYHLADFDVDGRDELVIERSDGNFENIKCFSYLDDRLVLSANTTILVIQTPSDGHIHFYSSRIYTPSEAIIHSAGRFITDRPVVMTESDEPDHAEQGSLVSGLPDIFQPSNGTAVFFDNTSGSFVSLNASVWPIEDYWGENTRHVRDLNADGFPDYADTQSRPGQLVIYTSRLESDRLRYEEQVLDLAGEGVFYIEDLNGDRMPDIAAIDFGDHRIKLFQNDGTGRFTGGQAIPFPATSATNEVEDGWGLYFNDLNGDGRIDLLAVNRDPTGGLKVYFGDGSGRFREGGFYKWGSYPDNAYDLIDVEHDFNGDGRPDVAFGYGDYRTCILLNDGQGGFPELRAMQVFLLSALGAAAALTLAFPVFRRDRPRWAGLTQAQRLVARARVWPALAGSVILFLVWLVFSAQLLDGWQALGLIVLFIGLLPFLPVLAAAGRPSRARFAAVLLGSSWAFLAVTMGSGLLLQTNLFMPASQARLLVTCIFYGLIMSVFGALSFLGIRRMKAMEAGSWPSSPVSPELVHYLDGTALRRYSLSSSARAYLVEQDPPSILTVTRDDWFHATLSAGAVRPAEHPDPGPVIAGLERKMDEAERPAETPPSEELRKRFTEAKEARNAGRLLGKVSHNEALFVMLYTGIMAASMAALLSTSSTFNTLAALAFVGAIPALISVLLTLNFRSSTRVYEHAIDHFGAFRYERTWLGDIRKVVALRRFAFGRLGPLFDIAHPSHYAVETSDGKRFHVSGESALLLKQALGPLWKELFHANAFMYVPGPRPGRRWLPTPSRYFGFIAGTIVGTFVLAAFFTVLLVGSMAFYFWSGKPALAVLGLVFFSVPLAYSMLGVIALRNLLDWHLGRIIAVKATLADPAMRETVDALPNASALRRAAIRAVVRPLPAALPRPREVRGMLAARSSIAAALCVLILVPLIGPYPPTAPYGGVNPGQTNPERFAFMNVTGNEVIRDRELFVPGDIVVGGSLRLENCTINMTGGFEIRGSLGLSGCTVTTDSRQTAYRCVAPDARLMVSVDLSRCRTAALSFGSSWRLPGGTSVGLRKDGAVLWKATGTSGWNTSVVGLDRFCGRAVVLDFAPSGWMADSEFQLSDLAIRTDNGTRPVDVYSEVISHGWARQESYAGVSIISRGGKVDIRDTDIELPFSGLWVELEDSTMNLTGVRLACTESSAQFSVARSALSITGSNLTNASIRLDRSTLAMGNTTLATVWGGIDATDSHLAIEDSRLVLGYDAFSLVNATGFVRRNEIETTQRLTVTPVSRVPCRLADFIDISGNHISDGTGYPRLDSGTAFEIHSSVPVTDLTTLAQQNTIDFEWICDIFAGLDPVVLNATGAKVSSDTQILSRVDWDVQVLDNSSNAVAARSEPGKWTDAGRTYLQYGVFPADQYYYGDGFLSGRLRRTAGGFERYSPANSTVWLKAEGDSGLAVAAADLSVLTAVDQRLKVNLTLADACDIGLESVTFNVDEAQQSLVCRFYVTFAGKAGTVNVTFRHSTGVLATVRVPGSQDTYAQAELPIDVIARNGTLELSAEATGSPDIDPSNNNLSWAVESLAGEHNFSGEVKAPVIWVLDNASVTFEDCELAFPAPEAFVLAAGNGSRLEFLNTSLSHERLDIQGVNDISFDACRISPFPGEAMTGYSDFSVSAENLTMSGCALAGTERLYTGCYLGASNISIRDSTFSNITFYTSGLVRMQNSSISDCADLEFSIFSGSELTGCRFSNATCYIIGEEQPCNLTFTNNTFRATTSIWIDAQTDIDSLTTRNTFSDPAVESLSVYWYLDVRVGLGWVQNLTPYEVSSIELECAGFDGNETVNLNFGSSGGMIGWTGMFPLEVARFNGTGMNILPAIPYTLRLTTVLGDGKTYSGTVAVEGTGPIELRLE